MRSTLLWITIAIAIAALAGPALADDDLDIDIPGLEATDLRGDALVWEDANFYLEPWDTGLAVNFAHFRNRRDEVGRAVPVRIVDSTLRGFVEIELPGRSDCTWRKLEPDARVAGLRLYVRRGDLAPALVKPYSAQYADGTKLKLAIGAPIAPLASGGYLVSARFDKLHVPIPHDAVGYLYKTGKVTEPELPPGKLVRIDRNTSARLGDESFPIRSAWLAAAPTTKPLDATLLHWSTRCVDMVVSVPPTAVRPTDRVKSGTGMAYVEAMLRTPFIMAGAPLSTVSGREVAVARTAIPIATPTSPCFDAKLTLSHEDETYGTAMRTVKLCAAASAVER